VIGNYNPKLGSGVLHFGRIPACDWFPITTRNSHYADGSRIRPRNGSPARIGLRPILAVLPLRGRIRADFGLVRVSGKNPKQRPSHSPDTNPEYPRAALDGCLEEKKQFPDAKFILYF
jgi:hypothetical protein